MNRETATLHFSEMFLSLLKGKTSLIDALRILSREGIESPVKDCAASLLSIMKKGKTLSESFHLIESCKVSFDSLYLSLITAAEATGNIDEVLEHIVYDLQRKQRAKENVQNIIIYPILVISIAIAGTVIIIAKGFPLFVERDLLSPNVLSDATAGIVMAGIVLLTGGSFLFIIYYRIFYHDSPEYTIFYILDFMLRSNFTLPQTLSYCIMSMKNTKYGKSLVMVKKDIASGVPFSVAFERIRCFTSYVSGWLSVADANGNIIEICGNIKAYYEQKDTKRRTVAAKLIEPAIIVLTGVYILIIMLTVVLPILTYAGAIL
jgi:type II secretory pathway component PulF